MNATKKESKKDLAFFAMNCVTHEHNIRYQHSKNIWGMIRILIDLRAEKKITEEQFIVSLKYIFSNYAENKIMEKIDYALDKTLLRHSLS